MINREMLEETFGNENVNKIIIAYGWNESNFEEKFKEEIYHYINIKEEYYRGEIILYNFRLLYVPNDIHPNDAEKIKETERVYNSILEWIENYRQDIISDKIQKLTFHSLTIPIKDIDSKKIL